MRRTDLPRVLGDAFTVGSARSAGVSPGRLRAADLMRPFHGVRVLASALDPEEQHDAVAEHLRRARHYALRMSEGEFFSHATAAMFWGIPLPPGSARRAVDIGVVAPRRLPRASGVRGHQLRAPHGVLQVEPSTGRPVLVPAFTWATLGAILPDLYDVVAAGDAFTRTWRTTNPLATLAELRSAVTPVRRVGGPALRAALPLIRSGSASRPETHARLILVDAGLPEPLLNADVFDDAGRRLLCGDLVYPTARVVIEYEGAHHRLDPQQWAQDIRRAERLAAAGWALVRVTARDVFDAPASFVMRVRRALADAHTRDS